MVKGLKSSKSKSIESLLTCYIQSSVSCNKVKGKKDLKCFLLYDYVERTEFSAEGLVAMFGFERAGGGAALGCENRW